MTDAQLAAPLGRMRILRSIAFAGAIGDESEIFGLDSAPSHAIAALAAMGLVEIDGIIAPTAAGLAALDDWYAADRAGIDEAARNQLIDAFRPLDRELKRLASAWQDADSRDDWDARMEAIEALSALHDRTVPYLKRLPERFGEYAERLGRARDRITDGETDYIASVRIDSYHTAWFTLHEDLLRLLERERDAE